MRKSKIFALLAVVVAVAVAVAIALIPGVPDKGTFSQERISIIDLGDLKELSGKKLTYVDLSGTKWDAPPRTLTDGATVPRLALPITNGRFDSAFLRAAIVHDAYCQEENKDRTPEQYRKRRWQDVHKMFYEASIAGGTPELTAKIMFAGVWLGGPKWDDPGLELPQVSNDVLTRGFTGSKAWINKNNPSIDQIIADIERREPILRDLEKFEIDIKAAEQAGDTTRARELLRDEEALINRELTRSPNDSMLLISKGYVHKNRAKIFRDTNVDNRATNELVRSEQAFQEVIVNDPQDPDPIALNELGAIALERGNLIRGRAFVNRALQIAPDYEVATRDLRTIENRIIEARPVEVQR